jgi:Ca-activated chloride channel family protein
MLLLAGLALAGSIDGRAAAPESGVVVREAPSGAGETGGAAAEGVPRATEESPPRRVTGIYEAVTVGRVVWPVDLKPSRPGACEGVKPAHIRVREDGEERRVTAVDRRRLPTIHAMVIDTSGSMMRWETWSREAAGEYVRGLPPEDRVMLATFDESLILQAPLTLVHESFLERLQPMEVRLYTALWDALSGILLYLEGRPERKILIVVTDGCDSVSLPIFNHETVLARAEAVENLTILPVVLGTHSRCPRGLRRFDAGPTDPRTVLESLARKTGGELYRLGSLSGMRDSFQEIRRRLDREGTIAYESVPFGDAAGDHPEGRDFYRRRVRIRSRDLPGCRVRSAGSPTRLVTRSTHHDEPVIASRFRWEEGGLVGEIRDLVRTRGALYQEQALAQGRYVISVDRKAAIAPRTVRGVVPPFREARLEAGGIDSLLLGAGEDDAAVPDLVQGLAFLGIQGDLGLALLEAPGYGDWARERIRRQREREADELLAEYARGGAVSTAARVAVRRAFLDRPLAPAEVRSLLSEWLQDLRALDLATSVERLAAGELLACRAASAGVTACGEKIRLRLEGAWRRLREWFPPPTRVRIKVPLVPVYDRHRDLFGFVRVLLPRPVEGGKPPADAIPVLPAAFDLLRWRLGSEESARSLEGAAGVERIRYSAATRAERAHLRDWLYRTERIVVTNDHTPLTVVEVALEGRPETPPPEPLRGYLYQECWKPEAERRWRLCTGLLRFGARPQCTVVGSLRTNGAIRASKVSPPSVSIWYEPSIVPNGVARGQ